MNGGARLAGNIVTVALLMVAVLAIVDGLGYNGNVCEEVTSSFHYGQCPSSTDVDADTNVITVTADTTLRGNHLGLIVIAADGVTLDCAAHTVLGDGPAGITVAGRSRVTIRNCALAGFEAAIQLTGTSQSRLIDNTITESMLGISLENSDNNELRGNTMTLLQSSITLDGSDGNDIVGNNIDRGASAIYVASSNANRIRDNQLVDAGMRLAGGAGNTVEGNYIRGNSLQGAIRVEGTEVTVTDNEIDRVGTAIAAEGHNAVVSGNRVTNANLGIAVDGTSASVNDNTLDVNTIGIQIRGEAHVVANNVIDGGTTAALKLRKAKKVRLTGNQVISGAVGLVMRSSRNNIVRNNDVTGATTGIGGFAVTVQNTFELNRGLGLIEPLVVSEDTVLSADHEGPVVFGADDVTLDCAGHRILASGPGKIVSHQTGITIEERSGVTLRNCQVSGYGTAIMLWEARDSTLEGNGGGLALHKSDRNEISGHSATSIALFSSNRNTVRDSAVAVGDIKLKRSNTNRITGNTLNGRGISAANAGNNVIANNEITGGRIHIHVAAGNTVRSNSVMREVGACILIGQVATDNLVEDNVATGCPVGFVVNNSEDNTISGNTATDCKTGFRLIDARATTLIGNTTNSPVGLDDRGRQDAGNTFRNNVGF